MSDDPIVDSGALARLEEWGGVALREKMISLFLTHAPERVEEIRAAVDRGALEVAERAAHSLKSSAGNVGAVRLQQLAETMEDAARRGEGEVLRRLVPALEAACEDALRALSELRTNEEQ